MLPVTAGLLILLSERNGGDEVTSFLYALMHLHEKFCLASS